MKKLLLSSFAFTCLAATLHAGPVETDSKAVVAPAPAPPEIFGTGFYLAIDMGANLHQDRGGDFTLTDGLGNFLEVRPKDDVGFFGGVKAGWVFGTGVVRPVLEADLFYNGFRGGADTTLSLADGTVTRGSTGTSYINTGAFMFNPMLKFGTGRFQPYVGGGIGIYYAESAGLDVTTPNGTISTGGGSSHTDLAWQVVAGVDYYFSPKFATFIEYRYLDYTSSQFDTREDRDLGQHLLGAGIRFHF